MVSGVTSGNEVEVLADGVPIGQATASGATVLVTTDGTTTLTDGSHSFTAIQIAKNRTVSITENGGSSPENDTADVPSLGTSAAVQLTVDTVAPQLAFTPATTAVVGVPYFCQAGISQASASGSAITYQLLQSPTGMAIDANSGMITWTPGANQQTTAQVTVQASDAAGNTNQLNYSINVLASNAAPVLFSANPSLGPTDENTAITINLAAFINGPAGTTTITDADNGAAIGGIALVGATGNGTWQYSLDGSNFTVLGTVSESSALLLANNAVLRYIPDGKNGETPTITYHAWDTTGGANGVRADLTQPGAVGGSTSFSTDTDAASLTVTSVNDAPVLTTVHPSLGSTTYLSAKTISLATFINNGSTGTTINDVDAGAVKGGIALTGTTGEGTWAYSLDGTTFTGVGTVANNSALLLPSTATLRYTPDGADAETATITYQAWDATSGQSGALADATTNGGTTAFSTDADTAAIAVVSPNTAPVLTPANPSLGNTTPTNAMNIKLMAFVNGGSGTTTVTDADSGAVVGGIALTGTTGKGTWAYSLDGTTFTSVGAVADNSALLLPSTATLRYTPDGSDAEMATITYRAWDTFTGQNGALADTTTNGGATAFSTAPDTAALNVAAGSLSGYVYLDSNHDGQRAASEAGLAGVTVRLYSQNSSGNWVELSGASPVQTDAAGYYSFQDLAVGTYQIQIAPCSEILLGCNTLGTVAGASRGTACQDGFQLQLGAGENGGNYNFGVLGLQPQMISLRMFLASTPPMYQVIQNMHAAPQLSLSGAGASSAFSTTYATQGAAVAIASSAASISSPDSPTLASMTVTIENLQDGSAELLQADTSGTPIKSSYSNGVLTLSGVADLSVYQNVLQNVKYSDTASSPSTATRTVSVVVNDGTAASAASTASLAFVDGSAPSGYWIMADQTTFNSTTAASGGFTIDGAEVAQHMPTPLAAAAEARP